MDNGKENGNYRDYREMDKTGIVWNCQLLLLRRSQNGDFSPSRGPKSQID